MAFDLLLPSPPLLADVAGFHDYVVVLVELIQLLSLKIHVLDEIRELFLGDHLYRLQAGQLLPLELVQNDEKVGVLLGLSKSFLLLVQLDEKPRLLNR